MDSDFQQQQADEERIRMFCDAIKRCADKGADIEDLKTFCRDAGVDIRYTVLGDEIKLTNRRAA